MEGIHYPSMISVLIHLTPYAYDYTGNNMADTVQQEIFKGRSKVILCSYAMLGMETINDSFAL